MSTKDNDYKGYALNPTVYLKTFSTEHIRSFTTKRQHLYISIGKDIIMPRELTWQEIAEINRFVSKAFPHWLHNEAAFKENLKIQNRFYVHRLLILSPILPFSLVIYFFADNGRDTLLTYTCFALMVLSCFILFRIFRKN